MGWSVLVEAVRPENDAETTIDDDQWDAFDVILTPHHGSTGAGGDTWSARITLDDTEAPTIEGACREAVRIVSAAANGAGLPAWPIERVDAWSEAELERDNRRPQLPDVVGTHEVTQILGITRQRLHQLRQGGRFPEPILEVAATPLWLRPAVVAFGEVPRPGGRPPRPAVPDVDMDGLLGAGQQRRRHPEQPG
jgi:hypothetical protein